MKMTIIFTDFEIDLRLVHEIFLAFCVYLIFFHYKVIVKTTCQWEMTHRFMSQK